MLCRCKSCVVKEEEEEEDDEKFFEKALQQNKTKFFGLTPSKNSKFFIQDFGV